MAFYITQLATVESNLPSSRLPHIGSEVEKWSIFLLESIGKTKKEEKFSFSLWFVIFKTCKENQTKSNSLVVPEWNGEKAFIFCILKQNLLFVFSLLDSGEKNAFTAKENWRCATILLYNFVLTMHIEDKEHVSFSVQRLSQTGQNDTKSQS